jgi:hypothetical protein
MQMTINGHLQTFIPLQTFRQQWHLPDDFNLAYFEPKAWQGLGSVEGAGPALALLKQRVVAAVPSLTTPAKLLSHIELLTRIFQQELIAANTQIRLQEVEVDFAVAGFQDVMQTAGYRLIQLSQLYRGDLAQIQAKFDFLAVYQEWLDSSVRIASRKTIYPWAGQQFRVRVIYNAYGRVGLDIRVAEEVYYVMDTALACPAASYMLSLCQEVAQGLAGALTL